MTRASLLTTCILAGLGVSMANFTAQANTQLAQQTSADRMEFQIDPGSLSNALAQYGELTGVSLVYPADLARGKTSPGASGIFSPSQALTVLLDGNRAEAGNLRRRDHHHKTRRHR